MASQMTLVFFITVTLTLLCVSYFLVKEGVSENEGFQPQPYSVNDLDINLCPTYTTEIQTAKGSTDCCQGDMVDGKCNGATFCTKSPAYPGVKACADKWREYFKDKGTKVCPPTMPNYFENIQNKNALKGCSAGPIVADGSVPKDRGAKQCRIYASEDDNLKKADSCYVERLRSRIQCPVVKSNSPAPSLQRWSWKDNSLLAFFTCNYPFEPNMPIVCYDKASVEKFWDASVPNWRTNIQYSEWLKANACENFLVTREQSRKEAERLEAERRAREAAERARQQEVERRKRAEDEAKRRAEETRRLQQQLDESNRQKQATIQFAWYGENYRTRGVDVTLRVRNALNSGSIPVNNNTFGDPAPGKAKKLFVDFTPPNSNTTKRVVANEGSTLSFLA